MYINQFCCKMVSSSCILLGYIKKVSEKEFMHIDFRFYLSETNIKTNIPRLTFVVCKIVLSNYPFLVESPR